MTLNDYQNRWMEDSQIDPSDLDNASVDVPMLHAKWWQYYSTERLRLKKLDMEYKVLLKQKWEWYAGKMLDAERTKLGWAPQPLKILSANIPMYLDADADMLALNIKRTLVEETLKFLEDVIKQINGRGYHIKNAIEFLKFKMGK